MARIYRDEDYRPRPNRRGSRPRTKNRPSHDTALEGLVTAVDRGRYRVVLGDGTGTFPSDDASGRAPEGSPRTVTAVRASHLRRDAVVPGDIVKVIGDTSGAPGSLARLVAITDRRTLLRRSADDTDPTERVIVANVEVMGIVTATADPEPSFGLIDRTMVAAIDAGITPLLIVTKTDLAPADEIAERFRATGVEIVSSGLQADGSLTDAEVYERLRGRMSVLVGHSGVGKSTLMNALVPAANRATGVVNDVTGRGRHTSSSAVCLPLTGGGWLVDTPGVRSFGLAHVDRDSLLAAFPELIDATLDCPRGCTHLADSPGCRLDDWVADGHAGPGGVSRLESLRRLLSNTG
ncbi:ribosome biogenesis GTPase [Brevibacterium sanguinis]|uniref:Small ribosomal subunit biogenesis GTPase RsgA n=2 Tax=Brevibacterium TaxID=1696 RepID=A0A366IKL4_9MICO|nr:MULTISPECIES: ribosome small subunit-dependent GTPase A [Brevibacterium]RBP66323.1 ribosome biogenesis GTPase [Brevibacterium sanguinis]RBP72974.1 ribosome biogenesis GTPase [Brevibacterium celere]